MKIECIAHRDGGSKVDIDSIEYHFEPLADGCHVADVPDVKHQDRFLSLGEGYRLYRGELAPVGKSVKLSLAVANDPTDIRRQYSKIAAVLYGSDVHEALYTIADQQIQLGEIVSKAFEASGLTPEDWNALEAEDRHARIDIALDDMADALDAAPVADESDERTALVAQYTEKFGKAPHYRLSIEKIKAAIDGAE